MRYIYCMEWGIIQAFILVFGGLYFLLFGHRKKKKPGILQDFTHNSIVLHLGNSGLLDFSYQINPMQLAEQNHPFLPFGRAAWYCNQPEFLSAFFGCRVLAKRSWPVVPGLEFSHSKGRIELYFSKHPGRFGVNPAELQLWWENVDGLLALLGGGLPVEGHLAWREDPSWVYRMAKYPQTALQISTLDPLITKRNDPGLWLEVFPHPEGPSWQELFESWNQLDATAKFHLLDCAKENWEDELEERTWQGLEEDPAILDASGWQALGKLSSPQFQEKWLDERWMSHSATVSGLLEFASRFPLENTLRFLEKHQYHPLVARFFLGRNEEKGSISPVGDQAGEISDSD